MIVLYSQRWLSERGSQSQQGEIPAFLSSCSLSTQLMYVPDLRLDVKQIVPRLMELKQKLKSYPVVA